MALMSSILDSEPSNFQEAADQQVWHDAMVEYTSIMKRLYKIKHVPNGSIDKFKARFAAREFSQTEGVDYEKTFSPVAQYISIRAIMSLASFMGWRIHQMDVKIAFLNVDIFGSNGRYSPPRQLSLEMKMPRSQRKTIEQIKEASEEIRRSQKRSRPHRKVIKNKYNAPEVKLTP
jgi:hypothetical protein